MAEPCPFCGARVTPIRRGVFKQCPRCGGTWYEGGGGGGRGVNPAAPGAACAAW